MITPINQFRGISIEDYRKLPNCLKLLKECLAVPHKGKTEARYKADLQKIAMKPCRVVLELVDISADYDYADFKLLTDDGKSGVDVLRQYGNLGNYTRHLKTSFAINKVKAKGLKAGRLSVGDRVVLVGMGYIVPASPWGAATPRHGMPRGDERQVLLRAFGKPNNFHLNDYEFAFMVRNWYIASQGQ